MANITIYSTPSCVYCKMAKDFLSENDIEFTEKNVAGDQEAMKEAVEKSGQMGVPVIDIDGKIMVGFDKEKMKEILEI